MVSFLGAFSQEYIDDDADSFFDYGVNVKDYFKESFVDKTQLHLSATWGILVAAIYFAKHFNQHICICLIICNTSVNQTDQTLWRNFTTRVIRAAPINVENPIFQGEIIVHNEGILHIPNA